jgi:heme-degrading monooxygenase HmoA
MISRHWKGVTRPGQAEGYTAHLRRETFPRLAAIPGFVRGSILHREVEGGTEFQIVTVWESWEAVRAFAGADPEAAVVPPVVRAMMSDYDDRVVHYEVAETDSPG